MTESTAELRYKVGLGLVLIEMFPQMDKIGQIILPGRRQVLKTDRGIIRAVGKDVTEYLVGEIAIIAPGNGVLIKDDDKVFRAMEQELIIAIDLKLTKAGYPAAIEVNKEDVKKTFSTHDGEKLDSVKV